MSDKVYEKKMMVYRGLAEAKGGGVYHFYADYDPETGQISNLGGWKKRLGDPRIGDIYEYEYSKGDDGLVTVRNVSKAEYIKRLEDENQIAEWQASTNALVKAQEAKKRAAKGKYDILDEHIESLARVYSRMRGAEKTAFITYVMSAIMGEDIDEGRRRARVAEKKAARLASDITRMKKRAKENLPKDVANIFDDI